MKLSEKILCLAAFLSSADNELLSDADGSDEVLKAVATALTIASDALNETAEYVAAREPEEATFSAEKLEEIAATAAELDANGMVKEAAVLDDILLTIGAPKSFFFNYKAAQESRVEQLKKKYQDNAKLVNETQNRTADDLKTLKDSGVIEPAKISQEGLKTRYCPDHSGVSTVKISSDEVQCPLDKRVYNYRSGFTLLNGKVVPGEDLSLQSQIMNQNMDNMHTIFDTRQDRVGTGNK